MISSFNLSILIYQSFHFTLQKSFQKQIYMTDINQLLLFLQLFTHRFYHYLLDLLFSLALLSFILVFFVKSIIECVQFTVSLMLFSYYCLLNWLKHISAFIAELRFMEIIIFEWFHSIPILFQCVVFNKISLLNYQDIMFEGCYHLFIDI